MSSEDYFYSPSQNQSQAEKGVEKEVDDVEELGEEEGEGRRRV